MEVSHQFSTRQLLEHFSNLFFHDVALAPSLSKALRVWDYHQQFDKRTLLSSGRARLINFRPLFVWNMHRHVPRAAIQLASADVLYLMIGVERVAQISRPILHKLAPLSCFVLYTENRLELDSSIADQVTLRSLPAPPGWERELTKIWPLLSERVKLARQRFNLSPHISSQLLALLAISVINVLRAEETLQQVRPRVVVVEHDRRPAESVFCQVARQLGIPSVTLVHGIQGVDADSDNQWVPLLADRVLVWGEWMRQYFLQQGVPSIRIQIGGYPRMHPLTSQDRHQAEKRLATDAQFDSRSRVLFVSSSLRNEKPSISLFLDTAAQNPGVHFMIRPHPQENLSWYSQQASLDYFTLQDPHVWSLDQSLASADIVVGSGSAACVDALLATRPLILVPESGHDHNTLPILNDAIGAGVAQFAHNPAELIRLINEILNETSPYCQAAADYASKCAAYLGDEAATISASLIAELASSSKH